LLDVGSQPRHHAIEALVRTRIIEVHAGDNCLRDDGIAIKNPQRNTRSENQNPSPMAAPRRTGVAIGEGVFESRRHLLIKSGGKIFAP